MSQPKAGQRSCHAVLSVHTLLPQTLSACKAPVIQPWNSQQTRSIPSPLPFSPSFHYLSFTSAFLCVSEHPSVSALTFSYLLSPFTPPTPFPCPPVTPCQGPGDSLRCGIPSAVLMILPPGPDQPEKYSYHFSPDRELSPRRRLRVGEFAWVCTLCTNI